ncbi:DUF881 domain-containing protein [Kitasatospora sp. NPDC059571]|uniref:DUF881 domain-containing protein n=1 Tax=Kitasatospora sp. NPDC059571 TaxID=3346871 RepID=UPI0036BF8A01
MSRMPATPTPSDGNGRFNRPDASMSLLTNVMDHSLDEGYAEAAARGDGRPVRLPGTLRGRLTLALGLALAATVVTVGGVNASKAEPTLAKERDALVHRVNDATRNADNLQHKVEDLRARVAKAQQDALPPGDDGGLAALAAAAGTGEIHGPGLKMVLDDAGDTTGGSANDPRQTDGFSNVGRLRDHDLQLMVNGLWASGAEALAINGQRLTALSAIRAAGDAVLVDNRPLVPPYTVLAIGDGAQIQKAFQATPAGRYLKLIQDTYGIKASISPQDRLTLPAALGVTLRTARPDAGVPGPGQPSATTGASTAGASASGTPSSTASAKPHPTGTGVPTP